MPRNGRFCCGPWAGIIVNRFLIITSLACFAYDVGEKRGSAGLLDLSAARWSFGAKLAWLDTVRFGGWKMLAGYGKCDGKYARV
jgi:hypothetical protein